MRAVNARCKPAVISLRLFYYQFNGHARSVGYAVASTLAIVTSGTGVHLLTWSL